MEVDSCEITKIIAVDFDGTLISVDSTKEFYKWKSKGRFGFIWNYYCQFIFSYFRYLFTHDYVPLKRKKIDWVRLNFDHLTIPSFHKHLHSYLNKDVMSRIESYSSPEVSVVVVSAGIRELLEEFCQRFDFKLIAYSMKDTYVNDLNRELKMKEIDEHFADNIIIAAFGNSQGDLPMLKVAKNAFWVDKNGSISEFSN